ncbi:hypothetical protein KAJ27_12895 [bacterium]|nr:hypothetical protein [bacterium]
MKRNNLIFCAVIVGLLVFFSSGLYSQGSTAKTFLLVETPTLGNKGVYDMTKGPNSPALFIPKHTHPTTGENVPPTTITCDRMENIYVTFERDNSLMPKCVTAGNYGTYYGGALPCVNTRTFSVTYAHPAGGNRTENFELSWDVNQGALFYKRNVDPKASWAADDMSNHSYGTHLSHLADKDGLDGNGNISPLFRTALCYPHSFWGTVPVGVDRTPVQLVDRPTEGQPCGTVVERWGQPVTGSIWLPNGVWYHDDHTDRTTAGRRGSHVDPVGKTKRFCFSVVDIYVALEKQDKAGTPEYSTDSLISSKPIEDAEAVYWQLAQCADNCDSTTGNTVTAGTGLKPTSYEVVMGPSGNIYMYSPYLTPSVQYLKADPTTGAPLPGAAWQPFDWKGADSGRTINVNCKSDLSDMRHIGVATKDATTDWVYFSSDDKFAVGDQFSGHGGILYCGAELPGGGFKVVHIQDIAQNHTVAATGPSQSFPNNANMVDVPIPSDVVDFSADGMGSFYYITKKAFGPWIVSSYFPNPPVWTNAADIGHPLCLKAQALLFQQFQTTLYVRDFDHGTKQVVSASQTRIAYKLNAGHRTNLGWDLKDDPSNTTPAPLPKPQANLANKVTDHTHVDIATVVDASPPINGECKVDIVPTDMSIKYSNNVDLIPVEDGQEYEWQFENWTTDYTKDGLDRNGAVLPVDNENGSVVDMVAPSATDPYDNFAGPLGVAEKNALHFNWGNQSRKTDRNNNGYTGGYASNVVGDVRCSSGTPNAQSIDSREYEWKLFCISKKGVTVMSGELVAVSGWKDVSQSGYKFKHRFIGQGVYELQLRARYNTYDYRRAGIIPVFTQNPDTYIDIDGGNDGGGIQDTSIIAPFSNNMIYYCRSSTGMGYPDNTVAKRIIVVGQKVPDYGCWVAGRTFVYSEKNALITHTTDPLINSVNDWKLRGSVGSSFAGGAAVINKLDENGANTIDPIEISENQRLWFETVLAVKYFKDVDEQTLADLKNENSVTTTSTSSSNESFDLNEKIHDLYSGVVPGSVSFELKVFDGAGTIVLTIEASSAAELVKKWTSDPLISESQTYCPGINAGRSSANSLNFSFDTQQESFGAGNIIAKLNTLGANSTGSNTLGAGNWDLSWLVGSTGGSSSSKYVPDLASIGMFYLDTTDLGLFLSTDPSATKDASVNKNGGISDYRGGSINMRYVTNSADYNTPTVGRVGTTEFDQNSLRATLKVFGDIKEWNFTPSKVASDVDYGPLTSAAGTPLDVALTFETNSVTLSGVVLMELPIDILVKDTSPPGTTVRLFNDGKVINGIRHKFTEAVSSGDFLTNDVIVTVEDNNPFYSQIPGYSDATLMPNLAVFNPDFSIAVAKTYRPVTSLVFTPESTTNLNWYDLTSFAIANPVELVPSFPFMSSNPLVPPASPILYNQVKGRRSIQVFTVPAYSVCIDPSGGWVFAMDWSTPTPSFTRPACAMALYATSVDGSGNGSWKTVADGIACIPDKDPNFEQLLVPGTTTFQTSPLFTQYPSTASSTVLDCSLPIDDDDPPEIYFAVNSNITNYGFTIQNKKYIGQDENFVNFDEFNTKMGKFIGGVLTVQERIDKMYSNDWFLRMINDSSLMNDYIKGGMSGALTDHSNPSGRIVSDNVTNTVNATKYKHKPTHSSYVSTILDPSSGKAGSLYISGFLPTGSVSIFTTEVVGGSEIWGISPAGGQGGRLTSEVNLVSLFNNGSEVVPISVIESSRFSVNIRAIDNKDGIMNLGTAQVIFTNETPIMQNIIPTIDGGFTKSPNSNDYYKTFIAQTADPDPKKYSVWSLSVYDSMGNSRILYIPMRVVPADFKVHTLGRRDDSNKGN